jgi:erythrocyte band 7 integral membrane protein
MTQQNQMILNPNFVGQPQYMIPNQGPPNNLYRAPIQQNMMQPGQPIPQNMYINQQPYPGGPNQPFYPQQMPIQGQVQGQPNNTGPNNKKFVPFNQAYEQSRQGSEYEPSKPQENDLMMNPNLLRNRDFNNDALQGNRNETYEGCQTTCGDIKGFLGTYVCQCCCPNPYKIVLQGFTGVIVRFGKFKSLVGPGIHYVNVDVDVLRLVDKREKTVDLSNQIVVSKDNMSLRINAILFYKIFDTYKSQFKAGDVGLLMRDLAQTTLRGMIGRLTMQEFLEKREALDKMILESMSKITVNWGVELKRVLVQDIQLPIEFRGTMSTTAIEKRISEAKLITAQADVESARLMKEMGELLNTNAALQIRYLETLNQISKSGNPKLVLFPTNYESIGFDNKPEKEDESDSLLN